MSENNLKFGLTLTEFVCRELLLRPLMLVHVHICHLEGAIADQIDGMTVP